MPLNHERITSAGLSTRGFIIPQSDPTPQASPQKENHPTGGPFESLKETRFFRHGEGSLGRHNDMV